MVMEGYFKRIWEKLGIDKIAMIWKGFFIVRFRTVKACLNVNTDGFLFFNEKSLILKLWEPDIVIDKDVVKTVPIWVKFYNLPFKYWGGGGKSMSKLAAIIGRLIKINQATKDKEKLHYARVVIEV